MSLYLGDQKIQNISVGLQNAGLDITGLNSETTTSFNGIIKGENGKATTAVPGTDYLAPDALNGLGDLANKNKVSLSDLNNDVNNKLNTLLDLDKLNTALNNGQLNTNNNYTPSQPGYLVDRKYVDTVALPSVGSADNGKILQVKNGAWAVEEAQSQTKVYAGSYTGDGTTSRNITLEFAPKVMFILISLKNAVSSSLPEEQKLYILMNGMTYALHSLPNGSNPNTISLSHNNFQIIGSSDSNVYKDGNQKGKVYNYILLA